MYSESFSLAQIQRARPSSSGAFDDVEINHSGGNIAMAQQILDGANVHTALKQMGSKRMAQRVAGGWLGEPGLAGALLELALHGGVMEVESCQTLGSWVRAKDG